MSVIEASFVRVAGTLADGTLRLVVDVEPINAQAAFALFNSPGTPMALAALKPGHGAVAVDEQPVPTPSNPGELKQREPLGDLCWRAVQWCKEPEFWSWMCSMNLMCDSEEGASRFVKSVCGVGSRKDLDTDKEAARKFHQYIRGPYQKHLIARGIVR